MLCGVHVVRKRRRGARKAWTTEERAAVNRHFREHILIHRVPRKDECEKCIASEPGLAHRDWRAVKFFVHTAAQKNKRVIGCQ